MENRIEVANNLGRVVDKAQHRGFSKWDSYVSRGNHDTILQVNLLCDNFGQFNKLLN